MPSSHSQPTPYGRRLPAGVWARPLLAVLMLAAVACGDSDPTGPSEIDGLSIWAVPLDDTTTSFPILHGQALNYLFTINGRGSIAGYQHRTRGDAQSGPNQPYLELPGRTFVSTGDNRFDLDDFQIPSESSFLEDDLELVLGPLETEDGIRVQRKIAIPFDSDWVRSLEIFMNPTSQPRTLAARITSPSIGSLLFDDTGDGTISTADRYFGTFLDGAGAVGILIDDDGSDRIDEIEDSSEETEFEWRDVSLAPGETAVYAHFAVFAADSVPAELDQLLQGILAEPCWEGLTTVEAQSLRNFDRPSCGNVFGGPGAASRGAVTARNLRTGESATVEVAADGSFSVGLSAAAGDSVRIRHEGGASADVVVGALTNDP